MIKYIGLRTIYREARLKQSKFLDEITDYEQKGSFSPLGYISS
jgi:hypothetical protein